MRIPIVIFCILSLNYNPILRAQSNAIELSGNILQLAIPGAAFISTIVYKEENYKGTWQIVKAGAVSTVVTYGLKLMIDKERPNGDMYAFPSGHSSRVFTGAAFIQRKYGWTYGVPAYLIAGYTGWTRVHGGMHDYWDIAAGAAVGIASSYLFTTPYATDNNFDFSFNAQKNLYALSFRYIF